MTRSITITLAALCGTLFTSNAAFAVDSLDADKDQFFTDASNPDEKDCDDTNPYVNPDAEEVYETTGEQIDNDCDPSTTATAPSTTCDAGYHVVIATVETCVADEPVVDAEAKACVDLLKVRTVEYFVGLRDECDKGNCEWHGPSDADENLRCVAKPKEGFDWFRGLVTDVRVIRAVQTADRARAAVDSVRDDLSADIQAEVEARTADIARLEDLINAAVSSEDLEKVKVSADTALELATSMGLVLVGCDPKDPKCDRTVQPGIVAQLQAMRLDVYGDGTDANPGRLALIEGRLTTVEADVAEEKQRPGAYFFVGARGTVGGQKPLALSFRDWEDGEVIGSFDRLARGGFVAGGGVEMAWGADFGHVRLGALAQVDFLRERGDTPKGEERSYTGIQPALSTEVQGDVAGDFRLGAAVGAAYHVTGVKMLSDARASQWSARFQARAAYTVPGTKLTLTASPFVDIGSCGARGYGENDDVETVSIKGCTAGGLSLAIGAGN